VFGMLRMKSFRYAIVCETPVLLYGYQWRSRVQGECKHVVVALLQVLIAGISCVQEMVRHSAGMSIWTMRHTNG
jgi:hypothetical protein